MSRLAISLATIFIFAAISDELSADAGGREAEDGEMGRADSRGRRAASTEVASLAAVRASTGAGPGAAAGRGGGSGSEFGALRFAAGRDGAGRALVWFEAGANWSDLVNGLEGRAESGFEAVRVAAGVDSAVRTLAWSEAGAT